MSCKIKKINKDFPLAIEMSIRPQAFDKTRKGIYQQVEALERVEHHGVFLSTTNIDSRTCFVGAGTTCKVCFTC